MDKLFPPSSPKSSEKSGFVVPPTIKDFKWRDDIFVDHLKKRISVEIQRHANFGSLDPGLYPKDCILEGDELQDDYLPRECRGRVWLKFAYDAHEECLAIGLVKLRFVPRRLADDTAPDVYINFSVLPNEKRQYLTRVYEATTDRDFGDDDECFPFQVPKAAHSQWALRVRLYDAGKRASLPPIGATIVPLAPIISALNNADESNSDEESSPGLAQAPNNVSVTVRCIDLHEIIGDDGDQIATPLSPGGNKAQGDHKTSNSSTPPSSSSPGNSAKLVRKLMAMNTALQQQLALAGVLNHHDHHHDHHTGVMQMSFCFSSAAGRLSISVHEFAFTCPPSEESGADQQATDNEHAGIDAYARLSLFEQGNKLLKSKRTRTAKVEKVGKTNNNNSSQGSSADKRNHQANAAKEAIVGEPEQTEHMLRFIELVVFKDLPPVEQLLNAYALRIQIMKTSLCSRDKPICRAFIGSAIYCRGKEQSNWEDILTNKCGEPVAFSIRLNPVFDED